MVRVMKQAKETKTFVWGRGYIILFSLLNLWGLYRRLYLVATVDFIEKDIFWWNFGLGYITAGFICFSLGFHTKQFQKAGFYLMGGSLALSGISRLVIILGQGLSFTLLNVVSSGFSLAAFISFMLSLRKLRQEKNAKE